MKEIEFADEKASSIAGEVLGSIRMIVACGAEGRIAKRYNGWVEESRRRGLKMSTIVGLQFAPSKTTLQYFVLLAPSERCFSISA